MDQKGGNQAKPYHGPVGFMIHDMERDGNPLHALSILSQKGGNQAKPYHGPYWSMIHDMERDGSSLTIWIIELIV